MRRQGRGVGLRGWGHLIAALSQDRPPLLFEHLLPTITVLHGRAVRAENPLHLRLHLLRHRTWKRSSERPGFHRQQ